MVNEYIYIYIYRNKNRRLSHLVIVCMNEFISFYENQLTDFTLLRKYLYNIYI